MGFVEVQLKESCEVGDARDGGAGSAVRKGTGEGTRLRIRGKEESMDQEVTQIQGSFK